jgi:small-conductance mechanosensitive channel
MSKLIDFLIKPLFTLFEHTITGKEIILVPAIVIFCLFLAKWFGRSDIRLVIDELFAKNDIVIAYPQRDVHIDGQLNLIFNHTE